MDSSKETLSFVIQRIGKEVALDEFGLIVAPERFQSRLWIDVCGKAYVRAILAIATQEEEVFDYPADWWHAFKQKHFPRWLKKKFPVRYERVWAIHKFPELNIPNEFVGREFVHFKVMKE